MKKATLLIFFFISIYSFSQKKKIIYLDEDINQISSNKFKQKIKSKLFDTAIVSNDTAIFYKLRFIEYFGTIPEVKKKQLNNYLLKSNEIDTKKVIVINYIDSIPNEKKMPKISMAYTLDSIGDITKKPISLKKFHRQKKRINSKKYIAVYNKYDYIQKLENKSSHYKNIQYLNYYKNNKGFPVKTLRKNNYYKDYKLVIHNMFNDGLMVYSTIILFPNGEFYTGKFDFGNTYHKKKIYDKAKKKWLKQFYRLQ